MTCEFQTSFDDWPQMRISPELATTPANTKAQAKPALALLAGRPGKCVVSPDLTGGCNPGQTSVRP